MFHPWGRGCCILVEILETGGGGGLPGGAVKDECPPELDARRAGAGPSGPVRRLGLPPTDLAGIVRHGRLSRGCREDSWEPTYFLSG